MGIAQQILHLADVLAIPVDHRAVANVLSRIGNREFGIAQPYQLSGLLNLSHDLLLLSRNKRAPSAASSDLLDHDRVSPLPTRERAMSPPFAYCRGLCAIFLPASIERG